METADTADTGRLAVELVLAVKRLHARFREKAGLAAGGLTTTQLSVLQRILDAGPVTAASLAGAEHITQQAIAQSLAPLREAGLVAAAPDPEDGRKTLLSGTDAGHRLRAQLYASRDAWLVRVLSAELSQDERARLADAVALVERLAAAE